MRLPSRLASLAAVPALFAAAALAQVDAKPAASAARTAGSGAAEERLELPPPPFTDGIFPCSGCHKDRKPDTTRRLLKDMHDDIQLRHDEQHRWCLDCHDANDRDSLHLASGERIPFERSYLLCGQCHGEKLRDWRAGVHGKRTGEWSSDGQKRYLLCAHCHNPHQPRFRSLQPKPAPQRPERPGAGGRP
ncbi:MAG TPA: hypothetical protein VEQ10_11430 [Vicinamibacteria bacterium]|nr:hypothetical protein [Vicinamibacteria bacterium]